MKTLKKLLTIILIVTILSTLLIIPSYAESDYANDALSLYNLKLYAGRSTTIYVPDLDSKLTREAGVALMVRYAGFENEVKALSESEIDEILSDAVDETLISPWARKYVAYAVKTKLYAGISLTSLVLDPLGDLTGEAFAAYLLRTLGYSPKWGEAILDLQSNSGLKVSQVVEMVQTKQMSRNLAAGMMFSALSAMTPDGEKAVDKLVEKGVITEAMAKDEGFNVGKKPQTTPLPTQPDGNLIFSETELVDLKTALLKFSIKLDEKSAESVDNYTFDGYTPKKAILGVDGKTVKIIAGDGKEAKNGQLIQIVAKKGLKDAWGNTMPAHMSHDAEYFDNELPIIESFVQKSKNTALITFKEALSQKPDVLIENGRYSCSVGKPQGFLLNEVLIAWSEDFTDGQNYIFRISDAVDLAKFKMKTTDKTLSFAASDNIAITATVDEDKEKNQTKICIKFNKDVTIISTYAEDYFYHDYYQWKPNEVKSENGTSTDDLWTLTFTDDPMTTVTKEIVIRGDLSHKIKDGWGNSITQDIKIPISGISSDNTSPSVVSCIAKEGSSKVIELKVSEEIMEDSAEYKFNYLVCDSDYKLYDIASVSYNNSEKKITVNMKDALVGKTVKIAIAGNKLMDSSPARNKMNEYVSPLISFTDDTPPDTGNIKGEIYPERYSNKAAIYITYPELMNIIGTTGYSVRNPENYMIDVATPADNWIQFTNPQISVVSETNNQTVIEIKIDKSSLYNGNEVLWIGWVSDKSGNRAQPVKIDLSLADGPEIVDVKQTSFNKVAIYFNEKLDYSSASPDDFWISKKSNNPNYIKNYSPASRYMDTDDKGNTIAIVTLPTNFINDEGLKADLSNKLMDDGNYILYIKENTMQSDRGVENAEFIGSTITIKDKWQPELYDILTYSNTSGTTYGAIKLTFTEPLDNSLDDYFGRDFDVKKGNIELLQGIDYLIDTGTDGNGRGYVEFRVFSIESYSEINNITISTSNSINYCKDTAGNYIKSFSEDDYSSMK